MTDGKSTTTTTLESQGPADKPAYSSFLHRSWTSNKAENLPPVAPVSQARAPTGRVRAACCSWCPARSPPARSRAHQNRTPWLPGRMTQVPRPLDSGFQVLANKTAGLGKMTNQSSRRRAQWLVDGAESGSVTSAAPYWLRQAT